MSMVRPASSSTSRSAQSITFGPSTAALGVSAAPRSSCSSASAAGSQSSCSSQIHSTCSSGGRAGPGRDAGGGRPVLQGARHRGAVPGGPVHAEHHALAQLGGQHRAAAIPAAGVDGHHALDRPGLLQQRVEDVRQPGSAVVGDDDRRDDMLGIRFGRRQGGLLGASGSGVAGPARQGCGLAQGSVPVNNTRPGPAPEGQTRALPGGRRAAGQRPVSPRQSPPVPPVRSG